MRMPYYEKRHPMKNAILTSIVSTVLILFTYFAVELFTPVSFGVREVEVKIPRGTSFKQAFIILSDASSRQDLMILYYVGAMRGDYRRLKAGYYQLKTGMYPLEILDKLIRGDTVKIKISVIPGHSLVEIAARFAATGTTDVRNFMKLSTDKKFLDTLKIDAPSIEGYLYPDTYILEKGIPPEEVISRMVNSQRKHYPSGFSEKAEELGMSENQVLTMASIIEKEARVDGERVIISAVYHNRLRLGMPLQADPTSIYGVKPYRSGVTAGDLKNDTPYNTYRISGLPPGPIASVSIKSIAAALNPSEVPYLYFVSRKDGTHQFSANFEEHREAISRYAKKFEAAGEPANPALDAGNNNGKTHGGKYAVQSTKSPAVKSPATKPPAAYKRTHRGKTIKTIRGKRR